MRLRFSLRLVFVIVTLSAVALYTMYVRPTAVANRFVAAVEGHDYVTAKAMSDKEWARARELFDPYHRSIRSPVIDRVYAEVLPREWNDVWACQRRIIFRVAYHDDTDGRRIEWTEDIDVVAHIQGLVISDMPHRIGLR